jgi:L-asparaginase
MGKIIVLGTGGTIAGTAASAGDSLGYRSAQLGVGDLLKAIPGIEQALAGHALAFEQVAQVDSKDMDFVLWQHLLERVAFWCDQPDVQAVVITHGTDTAEETAWFLSRTLATGKPVVLTCAMRPATALAPDGPQNLLDAISVAVHPEAAGVLLVCAGRIHTARDVQKIHTSRVDAFDSGDAGPLGFVEHGRLRLPRGWPLAPARADRVLMTTVLQARHWPWVAVICSHAGADARVVTSLQAAGVQGIVVAGTGNGTVHQALEGALLKARSAGVAVVRASRCAHGQVWSADDAPLPDSAGLSAVKARIDVFLQLLQR